MKRTYLKPETMIVHVTCLPLLGAFSEPETMRINVDNDTSLDPSAAFARGNSIWEDDND